TARPRRTLQALLLVLAVVIGVTAYALVGLGRYEQLPADLLPFGIGAAVLALVLQVVVSWRAPYAAPVILPITLRLNLLGIAVIASVDSAIDLYSRRDPTSYASRQQLWTVLGVLLCALVMFFLRDHRILRRYTWIAAVCGAVLLVLPML